MHDEPLNCRVCGEPAAFIGMGTLLKRSVKYFECPVCEYVQTEQPYWLDVAYDSAINVSDTGIMARNIFNARIVIATLLILRGARSKVLDYAGGLGILVRLLRDVGIDAKWSDRYCDNVIAKGFEYETGQVGMITAFEAFEHFVEPCVELDRMLSISSSVLISTLLIPKPTPQRENWWYYGSEHGQHIGFFRASTLRKLATDRGKYFYTYGSHYHLITERKLNENLWRLMLRLHFLMPMVSRLFLKSLTWTDHLAEAKRDTQKSA